MFKSLLCLVLLPNVLSVSTTIAVPSNDSIVTITLGAATVLGLTDGDLSQFLGIPFALPPVGNLRFRLPQLQSNYSGVLNATAFGSACPQQANMITQSLPAELASDFAQVLNESATSSAPLVESEDCLTLNVISPVNTTNTSKLPVVVWIYGGGFAIGASSEFDGTPIVKRSITLQQPILYVSINYRLNAFGFLGGQEVKNAGVGNLGLQDQRIALQWIQQHIVAFGGDPEKVTIWGESAGAISVASQMITNGGDNEGLFRAGFMESGSPWPAGDIIDGQPYYDSIVSSTNCGGSEDTLECLRGVPLADIKAVVNQLPNYLSFQSLRLAWPPRFDGVFFTANPQQLVLQGSVASIPIVSGDTEDEGTLFSLSTLNITTDDEFRAYISSNYMPLIDAADIDQVLALYPADPVQGSPFGSGDNFTFTPEYKRFAAFNGDYFFQAPRRLFIQQLADKQPVWSFLSERGKAGGMGAAHETDLNNIFNGGDMTDYLVNFVTTLSPNGPATQLIWPNYDNSSKQLLIFSDGDLPLIVTEDTFREEATAFITNLELRAPPA